MTREQCDIQLLASDIIYEIEKFKWLESEKLGYDIGANLAAQQWIKKHYVYWLEKYLRTH